MKTMNHKKYRPYPGVSLPGRTWPDRAVTQAPVWCSVDLRDGNQALSQPMSVEEKLEFFDLLVRTGFKEIEVGFPSASGTEFRFVRRLIEEKRIPEGVTIQVLVPAREAHIRRTFEAIDGSRLGIVHLYNSTSPVQREVVFGKSREEIKRLACDGARLIRELKEASGNPGIRFQYSPESFTATEPEYALEICAAVMAEWKPSPEEKMILNLPATVELSTPNLYADLIEWFGRRIPQRECVVISVHTHNDRGTGVAAAELAVMAGAERVEGALFGNGERSGNMDIMILAMNLFSQGVETGLDFSDIDSAAEIYRRTTRMEIHPRHPYAGGLVYTAFSGSHQDAISKGMKARNGRGGVWDVPYLPIDPQDVGRTYEALIRINSQSGKGGACHVLERDYGIQIPKWMQTGFGADVQKASDRLGRELSGAEIYEVFRQEYLERLSPWKLVKCRIDSEDDEFAAHGESAVDAVLENGRRRLEFKSSGNGPVDGFVKGLCRALNVSFRVEHYAEHALKQGSDAQAVAFVEVSGEGPGRFFGAGVDANISIASIKAVLNAVNCRV